MNAEIDIDGILARLVSPTPSCAEREAEVSAKKLDTWAKAMAKLGGYVHSRKSLEALRLYLAGYGLMIGGGVGSGKTMFFRAVAPVLRLAGRSDDVPEIYPMVDTVGRDVNAIRRHFLERSHREMVLDDIGAEPTFNEYGNRWDILPWLVDMRLGSAARTHFTTNLTPKELRDRYGVRLIDRLREMAATVTFGGKSMRNTKPNARAVRAAEAADGGNGGASC